MKYIITERQQSLIKKLFENDEYNKVMNTFQKYMIRRHDAIEKLVEEQIENEDPNDWEDEYDYADNILNNIVDILRYNAPSDFKSLFRGVSDDEIDEWFNTYIKDNWGADILEYYYDNKD